ncbi:MAG: hypothetical protein ACI9Y7_000896 [Dokdonia sp.]|jgi:hypothetical protein
MKKLKKLSLSKDVISNLQQRTVKGGVGKTYECPTPPITFNPCASYFIYC